MDLAPDHRNVSDSARSPTRGFRSVFAKWSRAPWIRGTMKDWLLHDQFGKTTDWLLTSTSLLPSRDAQRSQTGESCSYFALSTGPRGRSPCLPGQSLRLVASVSPGI